MTPPAEAPPTPTAAFLIIGNELLSGKIQEANLVELARLLRSLGIDLRRVVIAADEVEPLADEIAGLARAYDYVFTSGGVGPTHDDVTMKAVARAFGVPLVVDAAMERLLKSHYGPAFHEGHRRLALVPEGARLLSIEEARWPVTTMRNVWILPGVPEVFRMKLPILRAHLPQGRPFLSRAVFTRIEEPDLHPLLDAVVAAHPEVEVGSYPAWADPRYKTKVTFDARDETALARAVDDFLARLPPGEPQSVE